MCYGSHCLCFRRHGGPHVAFGPACVAALYAQHRGFISESKNIFLPLIGLNKPDVLAVSGLFAVLGYYINALCVRLAGGRVDTVAVAIAPLPVWGFAIVGCVFIACGKTMPVWHHIALIAGYASNMAYSGGGSDESCILWGVAFGVVAAYAGDLLAKLFSVYGEGFVDPPSMAVAAASVFLLGVFPALGLDNPASLFYWLIPIAALAVSAVLADVWRRRLKALNP